MACLYGEADPRAKASAEAHLKVCSQCREQVAHWRRVLGALDQDRATLAPSPPASRTVLSPAWAALIAACLALGFVGGRLAGPSRAEVRRELDRTRAALESSIRARYEADLREVALATVSATAEQNRRWLDQISVQLADARKEDRQVFLRALERLNELRLVDSTAVRAGLYDLVRYTGTGFEQAQARLNQISEVRPPQHGGATDPSGPQSPLQ